MQFSSATQEVLQTHTESNFGFLFSQPKSDLIYHFQVDFKPNWMPFGSKFIGKLEARSDFSWFNKNSKLISLRETPLFSLA